MKVVNALSNRPWRTVSRFKVSALLTLSLLLAGLALAPFFSSAHPNTNLTLPGQGQAVQTSTGLTEDQVRQAYGQLPISFIPNQGQTSSEVKFQSSGQG